MEPYMLIILSSIGTLGAWMSYTALFGGCDHPFNHLRVYKQETVTPVDKYSEKVDYHLKCTKCGAGDLKKLGTDGALTIKYSKQLMSWKDAVAETQKDMLAGRIPFPE